MLLLYTFHNNSIWFRRYEYGARRIISTCEYSSSSWSKREWSGRYLYITNVGLVIPWTLHSSIRSNIQSLQSTALKAPQLVMKKTMDDEVSASKWCKFAPLLEVKVIGERDPMRERPPFVYNINCNWSYPSKLWYVLSILLWIAFPCTMNAWSYFPGSSHLHMVWDRELWGRTIHHLTNSW